MSPPYVCSDAPESCAQELLGLVGHSTLRDLSSVQSRCVRASSLDPSLPDEAGVCQCDYTLPASELQLEGEDFVNPRAHHELGRTRARLLASTSVEDSCELRQTYLTDSVCLLDSAAFPGCDLAQPSTSCADACEQIRVRDSSEAEARLSGVELIGASCGADDCSKQLCHGAFRVGDRCYNAMRAALSVSLAEVSCDLPSEQLQSLELAGIAATACPSSATPRPYCTEGPAPTIIVTEPANDIRGMAIDADHLYWYTDSALFRQPKAGGSTEQLRSLDLYRVSRLVSDSSRLYWQKDYVIFSLPVDGGDPVGLVGDANIILGWAVHDSTVFYLSDRYLDNPSPTMGISPGDPDILHPVELRSVPSTGGDSTLLASLQVGPGPFSMKLAVDATGVYWNRPAFYSYETQSWRYPTLEKYAFADQSVTAIASSTALDPSLQSAGDRVLWGGDGFRWAISPDGSAVDLGKIQGLVSSDGTRVYWPSGPGGGNILSAPLAGGPAQQSSCVVFTPKTLLADEDSLYYLSQRGDRIARLPKPAAP